MNGDYQLVFFTPEMLLSKHKWRRLLLGEKYTQRLRVVVIDEAHTVKKWLELVIDIVIYHILQNIILQKVTQLDICN